MLASPLVSDHATLAPIAVALTGGDFSDSGATEAHQIDFEEATFRGVRSWVNWPLEWLTNPLNQVDKEEAQLRVERIITEKQEKKPPRVKRVKPGVER